ncbi:GNAT family N-acetyltransferase [Actinomycetospora termitidis]|uniref:GNAT family N-acetyltransferase n=1 Tax=Actinomycetospora termitidis TaxID=3053470 RepID=A0ABT7MC88_9PSEU|nr:GNAT family N-acetyltransferase [Actinomycetospora sp. Odt1-22]MDL5158281.1 GNAT family N-acetyltransferase [Actinomycetospora sp. Odt1-22]
MSVTIRPAEPDDVPILVRFVHELAAYEREPESCRLTEAQLDAALFGPSPAVFATVARVGGEVAGVAIWFLTYSTWTGVHGIHLEDLYVSPDHRRHGVARALLADLARTCVDRGYERLEWAVLDWNTPALDFYATLSSTPQDGWTTHRVDGDALQALAG